MAASSPASLWAFLLESKAGRMVLLGALVSALALALPWLSRRSRPTAATPDRSSGKNPAPGELPPSPAGFGDTLTLGESYQALIRRWGSDLAAARGDLDAARKELDQLRAAVQEERAARSSGEKDLGGILKELRDAATRPLGGSPARETTPRPLSAPPPPGTPAAGMIRSIELAPPRPPKEAPGRTARIPTASGGRATILNGVFAPVTGEPSPVRLRLDQAILGPNEARVPIERAFLIGKAIGDPNALRVSIQIDRLSYVKEHGESIEAKALGFVVGEDGREGVPGSYEWRAWEFVPLAVGTGALQGMSGALAQAQTTTSLTPLGGSTSILTGSALKLSGAQAAGGASGKLGDLIAERMKEIRPAVSIPAGRAVTVVFLEGVTLEGLDAAELDDAQTRDPFRGLDAPR